jgi:hypothetical protein
MMVASLLFSGLFMSTPAFAEQVADSNAHEEIVDDTVGIEPGKDIEHTIPLKDGGAVKIHLMDTRGEPVNARYVVTVKYRCSASSAEVTAARGIEICSFDDFKHFAPKQSLTIAYSTSILSGGRLECRKRKQSTFRIPCN